MNDKKRATIILNRLSTMEGLWLEIGQMLDEMEDERFLSLFSKGFPFPMDWTDQGLEFKNWSDDLANEWVSPRPVQRSTFVVEGSVDQIERLSEALKSPEMPNEVFDNQPDYGWAEDHYEISTMIQNHIDRGAGHPKDVIHQTQHGQGSAALAQLAYDWANEFNNEFKDTVWGEDSIEGYEHSEYYDVIDEWFKRKVKASLPQVTKTFGGTEDEMRNLEEAMKNCSNDLPKELK